MKYSVRSTYHLVYSKMWDFDRKLVYYGIAEVLFSAITPLVGVFMPSLIIACLEQQAGVQTLVLVCLSAFLVYGVIQRDSDLFRESLIDAVYSLSFKKVLE